MIWQRVYLVGFLFSEELEKYVSGALLKRAMSYRFAFAS